MQHSTTRRDFLSTVAVSALSSTTFAQQSAVGGVIGEPHAAEEGGKILQAGGNVVDAIVTGAATCAITAPHMCGFGGYGGQLILALEGGKKVTSIEFNTMAPASARPDMFIKDGKPDNMAHQYGWRSVGVPGLAAGLDMAIRKYGTIGFARAIAPAIRFCKDGFPVGATTETAFKNTVRLRKDPDSIKVYFPEGNAPSKGQFLKNPALAEVLQELASANSSEPFYKGQIAKRLCEDSARGGGLLEPKDMAAYKPRENEPVRWSYKDFEICTSPITSGGVTSLQAMAIMAALEQMGLKDSQRLLARVEALRFAWRDRLALFGDPDFAPNPTSRLLSDANCKAAAKEIFQALQKGKCLPEAAKTNTQAGTINLSAVDGKGNLAALTLTHGGTFGAQVTAGSVGLMMSHGLSRFNIEPGHPNSVAPGKRPLHNMCPAIILKNGKNHTALGGRGGRKIPNAAFEVMYQLTMANKSLKDAIASPRIHTEGNLEVFLEAPFGKEKLEALKAFGLNAKTGASAVVSATSVENGVSSPTMAMR